MKKELTGYASIDKPWQKYYKKANMTQQEIDLKIEKSMFQMLDEYTKDIEDNITIEYYGQTITNREFKKRILECAKSFATIGIKKGDIVPLILPNQPESRIMIYALNVLGAIAYPIQPTISSKQLRIIMEENNIKNLAIFRDFYTKFKNEVEGIENIIYTTGKESLPKIVQYADHMSHLTPLKLIPYNDFIKQTKSYKGIITPIYEKGKTAVVIGTSGTTGIPKGTCLSNENINAMALQNMYGQSGLERETTILNILIDSIGYGLGTMHYSGCCGLRTILIPELVTDIAPLILKYSPDHFTGGPVHAEMLEKFIKDPKNKEKIERLYYILYEKMKNWVSGGAPLKESTEEFFNKDKVLIKQGLGCTENGGAATYTIDGTYKKRSVGIPLLLETMAIFEKGTDNELKYYEEGEICITGPTVMQKYLNNPEETAKTIKVHRDGKRWIHTGDKGYMDEDGNIFIIGRFKKMTHRLGFNIHPSVIATELNNSKIQGMNECYVITLPHPKEQNVPVAIISINDELDVERIKEELIKYANKNLDQFGTPYDYVFIIGNLPRNIGGKVDETELLELINLDFEKDEQPQYQVIKTKKKILKKI